MEENKDNDKNYISLFEASKLCSYSEPYLRLRARQGKLKSIKLGKKWMTTALWIDDYSVRVQEWRDMIEAKKRNFTTAAFVAAPCELSVNLEREPALPAEQIAPPRAVFADAVKIKKECPVFCSDSRLIAPPFPPRRLKAFPSGQIYPVPKESQSSDISGFGWFGALLSGALCALLLFMTLGDSGVAGIANAGAAGGQVSKIAASLQESFKNLSFEIISDNSLKDLVDFADRFLSGK